MAHHVYSTKGIVLKSVPAGEADRIFSIFTFDLGLILASAKSVRMEKSKLRPSLQDLSISTISLVRGKHRWKITSSSLEENLFFTFRNSRLKLSVVAKLAGLLTTLLAGEEKNALLFEILDGGLNFLKNETLTKEEIDILETVIVFRILHNLGYVGDKDWHGSLLKDLWSQKILEEGKTIKTQIVKDINSALSASQLS